MDSKQRRQLRKAEQKGREASFKALESPSDEAVWIRQQWALLDARETELNQREAMMEEASEKIRRAYGELTDIIERKSEEKAFIMAERRVVASKIELEKQEKELQVRLQDLKTTQDQAIFELDRAKQVQIELNGATAIQRDLNMKLAEQISQVANMDLLKEVLIDLELDEDPMHIAVRIRERFGLLIAQW